MARRLRELGFEPVLVGGRQGESDPGRALARFESGVRQGLAEVETVFHLAGSGTATVSLEQQEWANLETSRRVARAVEETVFTGTVVFSSSAAVYGNSGSDPVSEQAECRPCSLLGQTKLAAEGELARRLAGRCRLRVARVFNPFGPGHAKLVVYQLARKILAREGRLEVFGTRDFVYVDPLVEALLLLGGALPGAADCLTVNVCSGHPMTIEELARRLILLAGQQLEDWEFGVPETRLTADACVGDPSALAALGFRVRRPRDEDFLATLRWIAEL